MPIFSSNSGLSTVVSGISNIVNSNYSVVVSGKSNQIKSGSDYSVVVGGNTNIVDVSSGYSSIGGGNSNSIVGADHSIIGNGSGNQILNGACCIIGGGQDNSVSGTYGYNFIGGGAGNSASGNYGSHVVCGGSGNSVSADYGYSSLVGGNNNSITSEYGFVGGGQSNACGGIYSSIVGGISNLISSSNSVILGGSYNVVTSASSLAFGTSVKTEVPGVRSFANGNFTVSGDAQTNHFALLARTINTTNTSLAPGNTILQLPDHCYWAFTVNIIGVAETGNAAVQFTRQGLVCRNDNTVSILGTVNTIGTDTFSGNSNGWSVSFAVGATGFPYFYIYVKGAANTNIRWAGDLNVAQVKLS